MTCVLTICEESSLIAVSCVNDFLFLFNSITFLIICWHLCDISDVSIDDFNCKIVRETVITSFFLCMCININYVTLKCSVLIKDAEKWLKSALLCKLKKVSLYLSLISKSCISKIFVCTSNTVAISAAFIKHYHFIAANVILNISFCAFKTSQHFFHESVTAFKITTAFSMWLDFKLITF